MYATFLPCVYSQQPHGFSGVHRQGSQVQFLHLQCGFGHTFASVMLSLPPFPQTYLTTIQYL